MGNILTKVVLTAKEELDEAINKLGSIADDNKILIEENKVAKQIDLDKLSSQMDEIATTGTTIEVVQNKVEEMAEAGEIQAYTIKDGGIPTSKYKDESVTPEKTSFIITGKNLMNVEDKSLLEEGFYYSQNNGNKVASENHVTASFYVKNSNTITISGLSANTTYITQFNKDGNFISGVKVYATFYTLTPHSECYEIKIAILSSNLNFLQVEYGENVTEYEKYYKKLKNIAYEGELYGKAKINNLEDFKFEEKNLYDKNSFENLYDKNIGANGAIGEMNGWMVTHFIKVNPNSQISIVDITTQISTAEGGAVQGYYQTYDINKQIVNTRESLSTEPPYVFTVGETVEWIRLTFKVNPNPKIYSNIMVCETSNNDWKTPYTKYGYNMPLLNVTQKNIAPSFYGWYDKKWVCIGDSNSSKRYWQKYLIDKLGLRFSLYAAGGTDASYWANDTILSEIVAEKPDVVTIMLGTNTSVTNGSFPTESIGVDYEFNTTSYIGAMSYIIRYISTNCPKCIIYLMTPPFANSKSNPFMDINNDVFTKIDILEKLCLYYGCKLINVYSELGVNMYNFKIFFDLAEDDGTHFNDEYGKRIAKIVERKFLESEPID